MAGPQIQVEGLPQFRRQITAAGHGVSDLGPAMGRIGALVIGSAIPRTPVRTGRLAGSYRATTSAGKAVISNSRPYSGAIEYGWRTRNITPRRMVRGAISSGQAGISRIVNDQLDRVAAGFNR